MAVTVLPSIFSGIPTAGSSPKYPVIVILLPFTLYVKSSAALSEIVANLGSSIGCVFLTLLISETVVSVFVFELTLDELDSLSFFAT